MQLVGGKSKQWSSGGGGGKKSYTQLSKMLCRSKWGAHTQLNTAHHY